MLAAELVRELRAGVERRARYSSTDAQPVPLNSDLAPRFFGAGGPRMAAAGVELAFDLTQHSVIGLSDVAEKLLSNFGKRLFEELFNPWPAIMRAARHHLRGFLRVQPSLCRSH